MRYNARQTGAQQDIKFHQATGTAVAITKRMYPLNVYMGDDGLDNCGRKVLSVTVVKLFSDPYTKLFHEVGNRSVVRRQIGADMAHILAKAAWNRVKMFAQILTNYLVDAQIPDRLFAWLHTFVSSKLLFLVILNAFLLVINMIEIFSAIIIVVPIIVPVAMNYGIDPIHLGVIFLLNLELGYMTPPLGLNLFLSSSRFDRKLPELYSATMRFWFILLGVLALVTYFPAFFFLNP